MVQIWDGVHYLNHNILVLVNLFGHFKHDCTVYERQQCTDRHLFRKVLMRLDEQQRQDDEDGIVLAFTEGLKVAHAICWRLLQLLLFHEVLSLVVDPSEVALLEDVENVANGLLLHAIDSMPLFVVYTFRLKRQAMIVLLQCVINLFNRRGTLQTDLCVDVNATLLHELFEVAKDEA